MPGSICLGQRKHKALATVLCLGQAILVARIPASQPLEFDLYNVSNPAILTPQPVFPAGSANFVSHPSTLVIIEIFKIIAKSGDVCFGHHCELLQTISPFVHVGQHWRVLAIEQLNVCTLPLTGHVPVHMWLFKYYVGPRIKLRKHRQSQRPTVTFAVATRGTILSVAESCTIVCAPRGQRLLRVTTEPFAHKGTMGARRANMFSRPPSPSNSCCPMFQGLQWRDCFGSMRVQGSSHLINRPRHA